jgi:hypothetical protein
MFAEWVPKRGEDTQLFSQFLCATNSDKLSEAHQWIHVLLPVLLAALRTLGDAPARSLAALAQRLGVTEADAATVVTPLAEESPPVVAAPVAAPASPLLPMTGRSGASSAPKTLLNRPTVIAGRKRTTLLKMSCS